MNFCQEYITVDYAP